MTAFPAGRRRLLAAGAAGLASPALAPSALAQPAWPTRPIRLVVPFAAGGGTDVVARIYATKMSELLGQPMAVDNRGGAGGNVGIENVVRSLADGYSLLLSSNGPVAVNRFLYPGLPFDPLRDLAPVSLAFRIEQALVVRPGLPAASVAEFVSLARTRELHWGSGGTGSTLHLAGALFNLRAGVQLTHVPYRGSAPALADLLAGRIDAMFDSLPSCLPQIRAGQLRALALCAAARHPLLPGVPTMQEAGIDGYEAGTWGAVFAPRGTPEAILQRLSAATQQALADPATRDRLAAAGADAQSSTPQELDALLRADSARWGEVVREANITSAG
ncbi:Bug family tripartite tricarboxylate transporter substrate binding protein [Falsiroseomonas tokyonensis]|uniref:Bug family tripartite tricarboxylate transporter substrate binding protein n=1 Tax=Falsiroseomonas tokyonensis TaxID=430521 RepID=A0ABV7BPQ5_9PROT|nr:tripartite tricarboxylate transporter substrate binding protein [Falsiroseomonas tokyonensis]MBU8536809.1 tripartite tricarboxylate transporter substrate binding protein [Falsiroseomonas tokyonensis]